MLASPMEMYSRKASNVFFPPDEPGSRFQYFRHLIVARNERVDFATCVLCSVTVHGLASRQVTALWGDVTVDGSVFGGIEVSGGRVTLLADARVEPPPLSAIGGEISVDPNAKTYTSFILSSPRYFYPGQRSFPAKGVGLFCLVALAAAICGGWMQSESFHKRLDAAVRRPVRSALLGVAIVALIYPLLYLAVVSLYMFPPLAYVFYFGTPGFYWFTLAIGFAAVSEWIGSLLVNARPLVARLTGAAVLITLMLIPVAGLFVWLAVILMALGAGGRTLLWPQPAVSAS
jgi:hypothetical protein